MKRRLFTPCGLVGLHHLALSASLALSAAENARAQQIGVVERNVNLRRDPSTNQTPIRLLLPPDELELLDSVKTNNDYNVLRAESGDTGWVWAHNVRVETVAPTPADSFLTSAAASQIDPSWPKPAPTVGTFRSPITGQTCGPTGDGGDRATNRLKNRTGVPISYNVVTFDAIGDLTYPATTATNRQNWPAESLAVITQFEGVAVQVIGYLVATKPQRGSGESTNCHMTRSSETDWHMALA